MGEFPQYYLSSGKTIGTSRNSWNTNTWNKGLGTGERDHSLFCFFVVVCLLVCFFVFLFLFFFFFALSLFSVVVLY